MILFKKQEKRLIGKYFLKPKEKTKKHNLSPSRYNNITLIFMPIDNISIMIGNETAASPKNIYKQLSGRSGFGLETRTSFLKLSLRWKIIYYHLIPIWGSLIASRKKRCEYICYPRLK